MNNHTHIGLDVHKDTIAVATLRPGSTSCEERVIPNTPGGYSRAWSAVSATRSPVSSAMKRGRPDTTPTACWTPWGCAAT